MLLPGWLLLGFVLSVCAVQHCTCTLGHGEPGLSGEARRRTLVRDIYALYQTHAGGAALYPRHTRPLTCGDITASQRATPRILIRFKQANHGERRTNLLTSVRAA